MTRGGISRIISGLASVLHFFIRTGGSIWGSTRKKRHKFMDHYILENINEISEIKLKIISEETHHLKH